MNRIFVVVVFIFTISLVACQPPSEPEEPLPPPGEEAEEVEEAEETEVEETESSQDTAAGAQAQSAGAYCVDFTGFQSTPSVNFGTALTLSGITFTSMGGSLVTNEGVVASTALEFLPDYPLRIDFPPSTTRIVLQVGVWTAGGLTLTAYDINNNVIGSQTLLIEGQVHQVVFDIPPGIETIIIEGRGGEATIEEICMEIGPS